jgi:hypothetical protein
MYAVIDRKSRIVRLELWKHRVATFLSVMFVQGKTSN